MIGKLSLLISISILLSCTPDSSTDPDFIDKVATKIKISQSLTELTNTNSISNLDSELMSFYALAVDDNDNIVSEVNVNWNLTNQLGELSLSSGSQVQFRANKNAGTEIISATHTSLGVDQVSLSISYTLSSKTGLVLWLKADGEVITTGADQVLQWTDHSGSEKSAIQSGADSLKPRLIENGLNSLPIIRFDGVSEELTGNSVISGASARTVFVVFKPISQPNSYNVPIDLSQVVAGSGSNYALTTEVGVRVSGTRIFSSSITNGSVSLLTTRNAVSTNVTATDAFLNGLSLTESSSAGAILNTSSSGYFIGRAAFTSSHCHCDIAEVIIYEEALSNSDLTDVEDYLTEKWGL